LESAVGELRPDLVLEGPSGKSFVVEFKIDESIHFASLDFINNVVQKLNPLKTSGVVIVTKHQPESIRRLAKDYDISLIEVPDNPEIAAEVVTKYLVRD